MAYSPSPHSPNFIVAGNFSRFNRPSPSPPLQLNLSKRDKKRNIMEQRLAEIGQNFAERRDFHYRQQLQSYQADMNYIQMANLYDNKPLDVYGHDIIDEGTASTAASVNGSLRSTQQAPMNGNSRLERPLKIGSYASRFQKEIGDAMEQRDADLTTLAYRYNYRIHEIQKDHTFAVEIVTEEHRLLTESLRQRLVHSVTQKKAALLKEKEKLDIADTNALLFHPNQFSINHSASPGGPQSNRKTRHARHRLEVEEWDLVAGNNKRKRKLPTDTENGSPAPAGRDIDTTNQLKEASGKPEAHQMATRLYSVDRLFSEKELNAVTQQASYDVINLHRAKKRKIDDFQATAASLITTNAESSEIEDNVIAEPNLGTDGAIEEVSLIALDMERTATNASYHATRSTRAVTLSNGLSTRESLGDLAGREAAVGLIGTYQKERKREEEYQRAPPVTELEAELDMALIEAAMKDEYSKAEKMLDDFLEDREDHVGGESIANGDVEVEDN